MPHYLVLLILEFLPARLAMLPYGLDSNVTQLLANMLTKPSVFYYLPIVPCNLVSIKLLLLRDSTCPKRSVKDGPNGEFMSTLSEPLFSRSTVLFAE